MRNWHGNLSPFGTFHTGSASALAIYAVLGIRPGLVLDFDASFFWTSGRKPFSDVVTHAATTNATMVDSDGLLKWRPHNLLTYSEDFTNAVWSKLVQGDGATPIVTANHSTAPDGKTTADRIQCSVTTNSGANYSLLRQSGSYPTVIKRGLWVKSNTGLDQTFALVATSSLSLVTATASWGFVEFETTSGSAQQFDISVGGGIGTSDSIDILVWGAHLYRSDLGGMVDNPDRGDSYVPTTSAAVYLPRRNHHVWNGSAWVNEGLLHESEARTNLLVESNDLSTQSGVRATLSVDQAVSPDGNSNAGSIADTAVAGDHRVDFTAVAISDATAYTFSAHLKQNTLSWCRMVLNSAEFGTQYANFNLSDGTIGAQTGLDAATVEDCGNGWYRCAITGTSIAAGASSKQVIQLATSNNTISYTGDGSSILIYGAQLEEGSTPSSHIPTSGSTATRAAETLTIPSANLPWSSSAVSIQMEGRQTGDNSTMFRWYADANNYITQGSGASDYTFEQADGGTVDSVTGGSFTSGILQPFNFASTHASTLVAAAVSGTALTDNTTPTALPDLQSTDVNLGHSFNGTIGVVRVWAGNITEAGRKEASS